jgi:hypothetical protein
VYEPTLGSGQDAGICLESSTEIPPISVNVGKSSRNLPGNTRGGSGNLVPQLMIRQYGAGIFKGQASFTMPDSLQPAGGRLAAGRAIEITEATIINLLAEGFGIPGFGTPRKPTKAAFGRLRQQLDDVFHEVRNGNYDDARLNWIDGKIIEHCFKEQHFSAFYNGIGGHQNVQYKGHRPKNLRITLAAICAAASDILFKKRGVPLSQRQIEIFEALERELQKEERANISTQEAPERNLTASSEAEAQAISIDQGHQPTINIKDSRFFPTESDVEDEAKTVSGVYFIYRRLFSKEKTIEFIVEYIEIKKSDSGPCLSFKLWTRVFPEGKHRAAVTGVGFFTDRAFWLLGHQRLPFRRLRVMAANISEWERHKNERQSFCTGVFMSHKQDNKGRVPQTRVAIFRRDRRSSDVSDELAEDKVRFLTRSGIEKLISSKEIAILDKESHAGFISRKRPRGKLDRHG